MNPWNEERIRKVIAHYEGQTEDEAVAEDEQVTLMNLKPGDVVTRMLAGIPMPLRVTATDGGVITCGAWTFDQTTGAEIDEDLGWGPPPLATGSYIVWP
jgi:hypothetical protein